MEARLLTLRWRMRRVVELDARVRRRIGRPRGVEGRADGLELAQLRRGRGVSRMA
eukprot:CAMPEP_0205860356 /NCGR_PEP_ID=MMETSP1083-20121108/5194_1 /ASSEMBLY_ACC=CAM_ASM_000430 /TAXON_ID=97485 /ORGANISM="Prymnesium parvum, Strain Texoma1" /LENGTH=54 /DNA_ID=CAMNT_0053221991 /DNA_START=444 /DNA_END=605 /DNA_ORIENTATION=-